MAVDRDVIAFSPQWSFSLLTVGKAQVLPVTLTMAPFCSSVPVANWNVAIIILLYLCSSYFDMEKCLL